MLLASSPTNALVALGAIATGIGTYLLGRRKTSGGIRTSEAEDLWKAMQEFQTRQSREIERLQHGLEATEESERECLVRCASLAADLDNLTRRHAVLTRDHHDLLVRVGNVEDAARLEADSAG